MAGLTEVGAQLVLLDGKATTDQVLAAADAYDKLAESIDRASASAKGGSASMGALSKESKATAASGDAFVAGSSSRAAAADAEADSVAKADAAHAGFGTTVKSVAAGSLGTFGKWGLLGGIGVGYEGIKQYQKYQYQITQLMTQAGVQQKQLSGLYSGGITISKDTGVKLATVGNQLYRIASARSGLHATNQELLSLAKQAANISVLFNTAPGAATEQVARIFGALATARSSGLQAVGSNQHIGALVNATVGAGDIRGSTLIGALGRGVLQSGSAVGAKLPTILAWISTSTRFGANASTSGTLIAHSLQQIATPSAQGQAAEAIFGIKQGQLRTIIQHQGIRPAISTLLNAVTSGGIHTAPTLAPVDYAGKYYTGRTAGIAQLTKWGVNRTLLGNLESGAPLSSNTQKTLQQFILTKIFGGARQEIPVLTLTQSHMFTSVLTEIGKHANQKTYQRDLAKSYSTPQQQQRIVEANLMASLVNIGKTIDPMWIKFLQGLEHLVDFFAKNRGALDALVGSVGGLVALGASAVALKHVISWIEAFQKLAKLMSSSSMLKWLNSPIFGGGGTATTAASETPLTANTSAVDLNTGAIERLTALLPEGMTPLGSRVLAGGAGAEGAEAGAAGAAGAEEGEVAAAGGLSLGAILGPVLKVGLAAGLAWAVANIAQSVIKKFTKTPHGYAGLFQYLAHPTSIVTNPRSATNPVSRRVADWISGYTAKVTNPTNILNQINKLRHTNSINTKQRVARERALYAKVRTMTTAGTFATSHTAHLDEQTLRTMIRRGGDKAPTTHDKNTFAGAYWLAINKGDFSSLQHLLSSGKALTTKTAKWFLGKTSSLTSSQIEQRVRQQRGSFVKAHDTPQALKFYAAVAKNHAQQLKLFYGAVSAHQLATQTGGFQSWIKGGMGQVPGVAAAEHGFGTRSATQQIRTTQDTIASSLSRIMSTPKMTANQKIEAESATINKTAANLMQDAAKKHGAAADEEKEAAQMLQDAANSLRNTHVNVTISAKTLTNATNRATAQAVARS